jgi:hypothetical protein
MVNRYGK